MSTGKPMPAQWTCRRRCRYRARHACPPSRSAVLLCLEQEELARNLRHQHAPRRHGNRLAGKQFCAHFAARPIGHRRHGNRLAGHAVRAPLQCIPIGIADGMPTARTCAWSVLVLTASTSAFERCAACVHTHFYTHVCTHRRVYPLRGHFEYRHAHTHARDMPSPMPRWSQYRADTELHRPGGVWDWHHQSS